MSNVHANPVALGTSHAGDNLTEREYAQWFYGTGKYANKE